MRTGTELQEREAAEAALDAKDIETAPGWAAGYCWANFCKYVFYGYARWPSYSFWMVPGTVTDIERAGWLK